MQQCPSDDPHVRSQSDNVAGWEVTRIIRWDFEEFRGIFSVTEPVMHIGASAKTPVTWNDEARTVFAEAYAKDLEVWDA